jgi:signal transduction histidine kinase
MRNTLARRLMLALALLLLGFGAVVALLGRQLAAEHERELLQRLSHGLARHIVEHWPELTQGPAAGDEAVARERLLQMLMVVNPGVEVYLLDADGRVADYLGEPGMVRVPSVDLAPVRGFLSGAPLPLRGTDPKGAGGDKIFSAAMFPPRPGDARPPGYLYVVLEGQAREQVALGIGAKRVGVTALVVAAIALALTLLAGLAIFYRLTRPLQRIAGRMRGFEIGGVAAGRPATVAAHDEVGAIAESFDAMARRIDAQVQAQREQAAAHREVIANVAHDLRTPLTALHGHVEALGHAPLDDTLRQRHAAAALAQSNKVRRLSQQLFELATLQSTDQVLQHERFRIDELVADAVQKFELAATPPPVALDGPPPGAIECDGDLHLIERALTNLIDNAVRHAGAAAPVRVSLSSDACQVQVLVEDRGPGLPEALAHRLDHDQPLRDPPVLRPGGGAGGLGLAIAQRIAWLHGGSLHTLPSPAGGTRLCLALPLQRAA